MTELTWTCDGRSFRCEQNALRLVVMPAPGGGYRYQVRRICAEPLSGFELASGHRVELRDALCSAERLAAVFMPRQPPPRMRAWQRPTASA